MGIPFPIAHWQPTVPSVGPVAAWTLDDLTTGLMDTVGGRVLAVGGTGVTTAPGVYGNAASFGGAGWLTTPDTSILRGATGFAVECWLNVPVLPTAQMMVVSKRSTILDWQMYLDAAAPGYIVNFVLYGATLAVSTGVLSPGTWYHLVGVYNGSVTRLYVNGSLVGTSLASATPPTAGTALFQIGARELSTSRAFLTGRIDAPAIYQFGAAGDPGAAFWLARYQAGLASLAGG
jgi:hypothetical protein